MVYFMESSSVFACPFSFEAITHLAIIKNRCKMYLYHVKHAIADTLTSFGLVEVRPTRSRLGPAVLYRGQSSVPSAGRESPPGREATLTEALARVGLNSVPASPNWP